MDMTCFSFFRRHQDLRPGLTYVAAPQLDSERLRLKCLSNEASRQSAVVEIFPA